jgi:hypothetical protein
VIFSLSLAEEPPTFRIVSVYASLGVNANRFHAHTLEDPLPHLHELEYEIHCDL